MHGRSWRGLLLHLAIAVTCTVCGAAPAADPSVGLKQIADIPLPGTTSRFDYQSLDPVTGRLLISHMGDGEVLVFDTTQSKIVARLPGCPVVTGVLAVPSLKRAYASVTKNHEIAVIDTEKLQIVKRIADGEFPDGIAYVPERHKLFVSDESGGAETVIDALTEAHIKTIPMGGEVGNTQYDSGAHLVYACVQTRNEFVTIDPTSDTIVARYRLQGADHPHGFYIDDKHRRAYISCQGNNRLLVWDLTRHQVEQDFAVGADPDVLSYDRTLDLLYVACEGGVVSLFRFADGALHKAGDVPVGANCHTVCVDSSTHRAYFPLKNVNGAPVLRIMQPQ